MLVTSRADPASKVRALGGRFRYYLPAKAHNNFPTVRELKHTSQHCCDKTVHNKMALYRECYFANCTKSL